MEIKKHNFANKILSAWVFAILAVGFLFFYFYQPAIAPERHDKIFCTMEAKLCPDGSYVSRTGPNCEFAECPNLSTSDVNDIPTPSVGISDWKTYRNEKYGFDVRYPANWTAQTSTFSIDLHPQGLNPNQVNGISIITINYNETPPNSVVYSYTRIKTINVGGDEILVKKRTPGPVNEKYIAEIKKENVTVEFRFYADRKYDDVFDQILSTFRFLE